MRNEGVWPSVRVGGARRLPRAVALVLAAVGPWSVAVGLALASDNPGRYRPSALLIVWVALCALFGGRGAARVGAIASPMAVWFCLIPPTWSFRIGSSTDLVSLGVYVVAVATVLVLVSAWDEAVSRESRLRRDTDAVIDNAPLGLALFDGALRFRRVNRALAAIDSIAPSDHIGRRPGELPGMASAVIEPMLAKVRDRGEPMEVIVSPEVIGSPSFRVHYYPVPAEAGEPRNVAAIVEDITASTRAQQRAESIAACASDLSAAMTVEEVGSSVLALIAKELSARCVLAIVSLAGDQLEVRSVEGYDAIVESVWRRHRWSLDEKNPLVDAARRVEWVEIPDGSSFDTVYPSLSNRRRAAGDEQTLSVPLRDVIGASKMACAVVHLAWPNPHAVEPLDRQLIAIVASLSELALSRIRLQEQREQDRFRSALDAMLDHVAVASAVRDKAGAIVDFEIIFANQASNDGAGRSADDLVGARVLQLYPSWIASGMFARFIDVVETGEPLVLDAAPYSDVLPDGRVIEGFWSLQVSRLGDGYIAASRDVTAQVQTAKRAVAAREARLAARVAIDVLQEAALPTRFPAVEWASFAARYTPASEAPIGGDWYDAFDLPQGRVGAVIADVAGHGSPAAAAMVQLRNKLRGASFDEPDTAVVMTRLNKMAVRSHALASRCYLVLDPTHSTVTWTLAGHPPPLLVRPNGETLWLDGPIDSMLGIEPRLAYRHGSTAVSAGDVLVLYTDGLIERRTESIDAGLDRLARTVQRSERDDLEAFCDVLVSMISTDTRADDTCVLVIALR
ncbi:MAG: SpoIIE family protein phosphatase [Acidimicrobiia bacterium]